MPGIYSQDSFVDGFRLCQLTCLMQFDGVLQFLSQLRGYRAYHCRLPIFWIILHGGILQLPELSGLNAPGPQLP